MAKGSFLGVKRGKLGDVVGYEVTNSKDKDKQGWRPYQPKVRNPQTDGQMVQRVKLAAVNNLYRALKDVIRRGFENHKYGDDSRRAWLKVALGQDFSTGPWMVKGSTQPVPIKTVPITVGSLPPVNVTYEAGGLEIFMTNIKAAESPSDVAALSTLFIAAGYQEGDQVTIIQGWVPGRLAFAWSYKSFYLDLSDSTSLSDLGLSVGTETVGGEDRLFLQLDMQCDALAIAVSRDGDGINLRSTSYAATDPTTVDAVYYGDMMYEAAKRSYMNTSATRSTNWPLDPGSEGGGGGSTVTAFTISGTEIVPGSLTNVAAEPAEIVDANGQRYFVRSHTSAGGTRYLYGQGDGDFTSSATAPTGATNANTIDPCAANNIASGCRAWLLSKGVSADLLVTT